MKKTVIYARTFFSPKAIRDAYAALETYIRVNLQVLIEPRKQESELEIWCSILAVSRGKEKINYDSEEEFFVDYRKVPDYASVLKYIGFSYSACVSFDLTFLNESTTVAVECPTRQGIEAVFDKIEEYVASSKLPEPEITTTQEQKPKIFIGHGHSLLWRDLKDHLTDKHNYDVVAYEVGARAGHAIRDILDDMLTQSSMAFLVLTGEDRDEEGKIHARENVIHETGLFQGHLGFPRAIVLLEKGTEEFSNIHGIDQLRFASGNIKEVFGDVIAIIKREFGNV